MDVYLPNVDMPKDDEVLTIRMCSVIVKSYLSNDRGRSETILDVRKWKELPFSENIAGEEMSK